MSNDDLLGEYLEIFLYPGKEVQIPKLELCKHDDIKCKSCNFYKQCFLRSLELRNIE